MLSENTWWMKTLNSITFTPRRILSGTKPNSIVIDSLSNTIRYALRSLDNNTGKYVIKYLTNLAPINFTASNNGIISNNILPTNLATSCGQISSTAS